MQNSLTDEQINRFRGAQARQTDTAYPMQDNEAVTALRSQLNSEGHTYNYRTDNIYMLSSEKLLDALDLTQALDNPTKTIKEAFETLAQQSGNALNADHIIFGESKTFYDQKPNINEKEAVRYDVAVTTDVLKAAGFNGFGKWTDSAKPPEASKRIR